MSSIFHLLDEEEVFSEYAGGAISRWAANMLRSGTEIVVCASHDGSWGFAPERVLVLPRWSWTKPVHSILSRLPWALQKALYLAVFEPLLARLRPGDCLYVHNRPECAAVLSTKANQGQFHLVLHMHNSHLTRLGSPQRAALRNTPIVFVSQYLLSEFHAMCPGHEGPTDVVYNGADREKFHQGARNKEGLPEIIFTGRVAFEKGAHVLVEAMRILESRQVRARCSIVGGSGFGGSRSTPYMRELETKLPSNTRMLGYRAGADLAKLLAQADIFCCPSIWQDPFPLAPLEAMASGLPVVASRAGGIPEALVWGGGLLVEPSNASQLADALELLVSDAKLREQMGLDALAAFQRHFQWTTVHAQYEDFLERIAYWPAREMQLD